MPKSRKNVGIETFTEDADELELIDDDEEEPVMAKDQAKAKARRAAAEAVDEEDDEDVETEEDDDEVDEPEDDDEGTEDDEDEDEDVDPNAFIPWIYHEDADWDLQEAFDAVGKGDPVVIYDLKNNVWYKFMPIRVGELPAEVTPE